MTGTLIVSPPLGLSWRPDLRLLGKGRNRKTIEELYQDLALSIRDEARLAETRTVWVPIVTERVASRLPPGFVPKWPAQPAMRATQGAFLARTMRRTDMSVNHRLADSVAAMHYEHICQVTEDPLTNVLSSWMFAVGYWSHQQTDPPAAVSRALIVLADERLTAQLSGLVAEGRFRKSAG